MKKYLVAITGGIGSGKSAVVGFLTEIGVDVIIADQINAELMTESSYIKLLEKAFPSVVSNGTIDKERLRKIVFNDKNELEKLNKLAHPLIMERMERKISESKSSIVFVEIPLLLEVGGHEAFDAVWLIKSDNDDRIRRIVMRDGIDEDLALKIIMSQASDLEREKIATRIIENSGDISVLKQRITDEYRRLKAHSVG